VSPVKYELGFYIPEDGILSSHRRENHKSFRGWIDQKCHTWLPSGAVYLVLRKRQ
jgi:hypothetical protein